MKASVLIGSNGLRAILQKLAGGIGCGLICLLLPLAARAAYTGTPPLLVVDGGTGQVTLTAHAVLLGAGTAGIVQVSPSATSGVGLVSAGASADPVFGTTVVAGGGTGVTTLTAHGIVLGEGTSNVAVLSPVADSVVVWGASSADPTTAGTSSTADSVLGWGAAGSTPAVMAMTSCSTATSAVSYNTSTHAFGCNSISSGGVALTTEAIASTATITISAANGKTSIINSGTPATTINLPTAVQTAGWRQCIKDGTENFTTNPATIKSPTSGTIDGVAGATGVAINQVKQELCFLSDGTNWYIE